MSKPSLSQGVLIAIEDLADQVRWLYESDANQATDTFQSSIRVLARLEELVKTHANPADWDEHVRHMQACHIKLPEQAQRG